MLNFATFAIALIAITARAHPGATPEELQAEILARSEYISSLENQNLLHCEKKLRKRDGSSLSGLEAIARRRIERVAELRKSLNLETGDSYHKVKRQIPGGGKGGFPPGFPPGGFPGGFPKGGPPPGFGDFEVPEVAKKSHKSNLTIVNPSQADWALLGQNKSVILSPESIEGPFYVRGEQIRRNLKEKEQGVDMHLDIQVVDINTCEPLKDIAVEIWAANATGVYSGVISPMNGNANDTANLQNQALRGVQITGKDGSVAFETLIPGHYTGRAVHIHLATHLGITKNPNNTISGGTTAHVGQLYIDQTLVDEVAALSPYTLNPMERTPNDKDGLLATSAANGSDPIVEYVLLGKSVQQGIFGWINFGVDSKQKIPMQPATLCTSEGCKVNPDAQDILNGAMPPPGLPGGFPGGLPGFPPGGKGVPKGKSGRT